MRALITGVNGFVGGHLAEHLLALGGWQVWGVGRQDELALATLRGRVSYLCADIEQPEAVERVLAQAQPSAIFHLAGQAFVPRSFEDPAGTLTTNIFGQLYLLLGMLKLGLDAVVLVAGSNEVYGRVPTEELPISERQPLRPVSPYGVSKAAQDLLALQYFQSHALKTIRVRPFNHLGPRQDNRFVAPAFAQQIALIEAGRQPPVLRVGNLSAQRDLTDVRDIVRAYALAVQYGTPGEVYNIGSGQPVAMQRLLDLLLQHSSCPISVEPDPARMRPADVPLVSCDYSRFHAATGWRPAIGLEQTLRDVLDDWRGRV